jgi:hypothetical protein
MAATNAKVPVSITASLVLLTLPFLAESSVLLAVIDTNVLSGSLSTVFQVHNTRFQ